MSMKKPRATPKRPSSPATRIKRSIGGKTKSRTGKRK